MSYKTIEESEDTMVRFSLKYIELKQNKKGEWKKEVQPHDKKGWQKLKKTEITPGDKVMCLVTGATSGVTVIDLDNFTPKQIQEFAKKYCLYNSCFMCPPAVKTLRGAHLYFKYTPDAKGGQYQEDGFDICNDGQRAYYTGTSYVTNEGDIFEYKWVDLGQPLADDDGFDEVAYDNEVTYTYHKLRPMSDELLGFLRERGALKSCQPSPKQNDTDNVNEEIFIEKQDASKDASKDNELNRNIIRLINIQPYLDEGMYWRPIVWALRTEKFDKEFAREISKKSDKYDDDEFEKQWRFAGHEKEKGYTLGTLKYYARLSNEASYIALHTQRDAAQQLNFDDWTHTMLAEKFDELQCDDVIYQNETLFVYYKEKWREDKKATLTKRIFSQVMTTYFKGLPNGDNLFKKAIKQVQNATPLLGCIDCLKSVLAGKLQRVIFDVGEDQMFNIHFNNGVYDLKKKEFRGRTKTDFVTQILDYDYAPETKIADSVKEDVRMFFQKLQPDEEERSFTLSYLAYCLSGDTGHQVMKMNIGYSAQNGKSTELKIHQMAFPIYTTKLNKRTFNVGFEKAHKEFLQLIRNPIRLAYIEELDRKAIDVDVLKDFVDGKDLSVEILYGTKEVQSHQCKLATLSNKDPNMEADEGVTRRMRVQHYLSKFIAETEDNFSTHEYVRVLNYENRFEKPEYKLAYFHLLLKHIDALKIPASAKLAFQSIAADYDEFANHLEEQYKVTKKEEDQVAKGDLEAHFSNMKWNKVLSELKRMGVTYKRDQRLDNKRGVIYGLKKVEDSDSD